MKNIKDDALIALLQSGKRHENDRALSYLYQKHYRMLESLVQKYNGSDADAQDVFQDSLIVLFNQVKSGQFELKSSISTYLYAIARNIWFKKFRTVSKESELQAVHEAIPEEENQLGFLEKSEKSNLIAQLLGQLDEKCRKLLLLFYYERQRMKYIADEMGWQSEQVAKNQKTLCMKKLKGMVNANPNLKMNLR